MLYFVKYPDAHIRGIVHLSMKTTCPIEKTAQLLCDEWTILIVRDVLRAPQRFCELERSLEGISTRTLACKLKKLEAEKVIMKRPDGAYEATAKGRGLRTVENAMRRFGERYL